MPVVVGNPFRISTPHRLGIKAGPAVICSANLPIGSRVQIIDFLRIIIRKVEMSIRRIPGHSCRLIRHGNHRGRHPGDIRRVDHIAVQGCFPDVDPLKMGDSANGFFDFSITHHKCIAGGYISQSRWIRARWIVGRSVDGFHQTSHEIGRVRSRKLGEGKLCDIAGSGQRLAPCTRTLTAFR